MVKYIHSVIMKAFKAWWLRGHLIVLIIIGIGLTDQVRHPVAESKTKEIVYEKSISRPRVSGGYGGKLTPPKSVSTATSAKVPAIIPTASGDPGFSPFPACFFNVTQYYGQNGEQGDDFGCRYHTLTPALWSGTIVAAERTCWDVRCDSTSGGLIAINSSIPGLGLETTYYLHIDMLYPGIHLGEYVKKGQIIAYSGGQTSGGNWNADTQFSQGPHLEIGFSAWFICKPDYHITCSGKNVNPLYYIERARDAR